MIVNYLWWVLSIVGTGLFAMLFMALVINTLGNAVSDVMLRYQRLKFEMVIRNQEMFNVALSEAAKE